MGKTLSEKILSSKSGVDAKAGDIVVVPVDKVYAHDVSGPLAIRQFKESGFKKLACPEFTFFFLDHAVPCPRKELANDQKFIREFVQEQGCQISGINEGVCHQIAVEKWVCPSDIVCGGDSHTPTAGGLCAFATGMGSTDIAVAMALGKTWLRVPESFLVKITGQLSPVVHAKDIALHLIGLLSAEGATYKTLEFGGDAIRTMTIAQRFTLANMSVEAGAKAGLFPADEITKDYLENHGRGNSYLELFPDPDASYERVIEIEAQKLVPLVAQPHTVDNVIPVSEVEGAQIDQVFIGSCTNGRLEDLAITARIMQGKKRYPQTRLVIVPASRGVYHEAMTKGYIATFIDAGATVVNPGCAACAGVHEGILADGELCLSTTNRNFKGRMGNPKSFVYLASPATAAASAITGKITSPEKFMA